LITAVLDAGYLSFSTCLPASPQQLAVRALHISQQLAVRALHISQQLAVHALHISQQLAVRALHISQQLAVHALHISQQLAVHALHISQPKLRQHLHICMHTPRHKLDMAAGLTDTHPCSKPRRDAMHVDSWCEQLEAAMHKVKHSMERQDAQQQEKKKNTNSLQAAADLQVVDRQKLDIHTVLCQLIGCC
jgi:hypothetical protein